MRLLLLLVAILVLSPSPPAQAGREYVIGVPQLNPEWSFDEFQDILRETYARAGEKVGFRLLPMRRDLLDANRGKTDGSLGRLAGVQTEYANLISVPTPIARFSISAFTIDASLKVNVPADLTGRRVAGMFGDVGVSRVAEMAGVDFTPCRSIAHAMELLRTRRIDAALVQTTFGKLLADEIGMDVYVSEPFKTSHFHHLVHKKHLALVPKLDMALRSMIEDGTMAALLGKYKAMLPDIPHLPYTPLSPATPALLACGVPSPQ